MAPAVAPRSAPLWVPDPRWGP